MNKNKNEFKLLIGDNLYTYMARRKRGFNELLKDLVFKYGEVKKEKYNSGYFNPDTMKFEIIDYDLKKYDELIVTECIRNQNCKICDRVNGVDFQSYSGYVTAINYPEIYIIMTENINMNTIVKLTNWYCNNKNVSDEEKYNIITEIFEYLDFELTNVQSYEKYIREADGLKETLREKIDLLKELSKINIILNDSELAIRSLFYSKINYDIVDYQNNINIDEHVNKDTDLIKKHCY